VRLGQERLALFAAQGHGGLLQRMAGTDAEHNVGRADGCSPCGAVETWASMR
jgi:hypothetical protein